MLHQADCHSVAAVLSHTCQLSGSLSMVSTQGRPALSVGACHQSAPPLGIPQLTTITCDGTPAIEKLKDTLKNIENIGRCARAWTDMQARESRGDLRQAEGHTALLQHLVAALLIKPATLGALRPQAVRQQLLKFRPLLFHCGGPATSRGIAHHASAWRR